MTNPEPAATKVFISYSRDSDEEAGRVLALANRLRADGIDCMIDQYQSAPEEGWPVWLQGRLHEADFILLVCSPCYRQRLDGQPRDSRGIEELWEDYLIHQYICAGQPDPRFIPVLLEGHDETAIPSSLKNDRCYRTETPQGYAGLLRLIATPDRSIA